jgi:archaellum component FlaG (FlaF/FlaG flagellin family)
MRKLTYPIGVLLAVGAVASILIAGSASGAVQSQTYQATVSPKKQSKKAFGAAAITNVINTQYQGFNPSPSSTVIKFSKDIKFTPGKKAQCPVSSVSGKPTASAKAACGSAVIGQGDAQLNNGGLTAVITAFNGVPSGGPTVILHVDINNGSLIIDLTGSLNTKSNTLTVASIPNTPGNVLTHFAVTINKVKTGKKSFYVAARCSKKKKWVNTETTTYSDGSSTSATSVQKCKQKK